MNRIRELQTSEDLVAVIDEQGLELASLRFEVVYVIFAIALVVAIPLRPAPLWLKVGVMALVFSPIVLWGMAVQRYTSAKLTRDGVHTDAGFASWKDVRLAPDGRGPRRSPGRPLFAPRTLHLRVDGAPLICLASAPALPRRMRDPLGFVPFLHEAVAAKIAAAGGTP